MHVPFCVGQAPSPEALLAAADSFHFFERFAPWSPGGKSGAEGGGDCNAEAVLAGGSCHRERALAVFRNSSAALLCSGLAAAQIIWMGQLMKLPPDFRHACRLRLKSPTTA